MSKTDTLTKPATFTGHIVPVETASTRLGIQKWYSTDYIAFNHNEISLTARTESVLEYLRELAAFVRKQGFEESQRWEKSGIVYYSGTIAMEAINKEISRITAQELGVIDADEESILATNAAIAAEAPPAEPYVLTVEAFFPPSQGFDKAGLPNLTPEQLAAETIVALQEGDNTAAERFAARLVKSLARRIRKGE
jgi:hypothetical protein